LEKELAKVIGITGDRLPDRMMIGACEVDLKAHRVSNGAAEIRLTPKAAGVLEYLAERAGRAVTRNELLDHVWRDAFPTDDVLSHAITELRRALGDSPRNSKVIETIPKVGYRLLLTPGVAAEADAREGLQAGAAHRRFVGAIVASAMAGVILGAGGMRAFLNRAETTVQQPSRFIVDPLANAVPVTSDIGTEQMPAVSADGRQVVYSAEGEFTEGFDLYVRNLGADSAMQLTATPGEDELSPSWSPDGEQVAFYRYSGEDCGLFTRPVLGGFERRLSDCGTEAISYIDWSPDGATIAMTGLRDDQALVTSILLLHIDSGLVSALDYDSDPAEHDVQPRYSPDAQSILFRRGAFPRSDLFVVAAAGGRARRLTQHGSQILGFDWVPDSSAVLYCSDHAGRSSLYRLHLASGETSLQQTGCPYMLSIASKSRVVVYEQRKMDPNVEEVHLGERGMHIRLPVFDSTQNESYPAYAPDTNQIAFVSDRSGDEQLWIGNLISGSAYQLTQHSGLHLIGLRWSPDGDYVYYVARGAGGERLFRISANSGVVEQLSQDPENVRTVEVSKDGKSVFYTSDMSAGWEVWVLDLDSGKRQRITSSGGHRPVDPHGDGMVYYTKLNVFGLWRMPVAGGTEELVSDLIRYYNHDDWQLNKTGLYLRLYDPDEQLSVYHQDLQASAAPELILRGVANEILELHDVTADGQRLLLVRVSAPSQDIMAASGW
jgi:Tol biopolymer transport system component/DNA-binding winged helix-turn-helix (wHTH) protein